MAIKIFRLTLVVSEVAKQFGWRLLEKAVTRYNLLSDVIKSFCFATAKL